MQRTFGRGVSDVFHIELGTLPITLLDVDINDDQSHSLQALDVS